MRPGKAMPRGASPPSMTTRRGLRRGPTGARVVVFVALESARATAMTAPSRRWFSPTRGMYMLMVERRWATADRRRLRHGRLRRGHRRATVGPALQRHRQQHHGASGGGQPMGDLTSLGRASVGPRRGTIRVRWYDAASGAQLWVKRYTGSGSATDQASSVAVSPTGNRVSSPGPAPERRPVMTTSRSAIAADTVRPRWPGWS